MQSVLLWLQCADMTYQNKHDSREGIRVQRECTMCFPCFLKLCVIHTITNNIIHTNSNKQRTGMALYIHSKHTQQCILIHACICMIVIIIIVIVQCNNFHI